MKCFPLRQLEEKSHRITYQSAADWLKMVSRTLKAHPSSRKIIPKLKIQTRQFKDKFYEILKDFCLSTSLHGFLQIAHDFSELKDKRMSPRSVLFSHLSNLSSYLWLPLSFCRQRLLLKWLSVTFWGGSILIGTIFAIIFVILVWQRFELKPTITRVETNFYPIWNVPFPSVTICNINKVYRPATLNITKKL